MQAADSDETREGPAINDPVDITAVFLRNCLRFVLIFINGLVLASYKVLKIGRKNDIRINKKRPIILLSGCLYFREMLLNLV